MVNGCSDIQDMLGVQGKYLLWPRLFNSASEACLAYWLSGLAWRASRARGYEAISAQNYAHLYVWLAIWQEPLVEQNA